MRNALSFLFFLAVMAVLVIETMGGFHILTK